MRRLILWACFVLSPISVSGRLSAQQQGLYLITGAPNNTRGYLCFCDSELYKVASGQPVLVQRLVTHEDRGLHTVLPDYDRNVVFVASPGGDYQNLGAISMKDPCRVVTRPALVKEIPTTSWIPWPPSPYRIPPGQPPTLTSMNLVGSGPDALVRLRFAGEQGHAEVVYAWNEASATLAPRPSPTTALSGVRIHG